MINLISSSQNEGQEALPFLYFCTVCWIFFFFRRTDTIFEIFKGHFHLRGKHTIHFYMLRELRFPNGSEIEEQE